MSKFYYSGMLTKYLRFGLESFPIVILVFRLSLMFGYFLPFESRVLVELAIPCKEKGVRVFEGFTVGFHPRSWEIVRDQVICTNRSKKLCSCQLKFHMNELLWTRRFTMAWLNWVLISLTMPSGVGFCPSQFLRFIWFLLFSGHCNEWFVFARVLACVRLLNWTSIMSILHSDLLLITKKFSLSNCNAMAFYWLYMPLVRRSGVGSVYPCCVCVGMHLYMILAASLSC